MPMNAFLKTYADAVRTLHKTGRATEHTYRGALAALLDALLPHYHAVNEPKHTECGAPDYALVGRRDRIPHAYIEAKDLFDGDLLGLKPKQNKPQFDRYKAALARVAFTDYLTFHFFANGEKTASVTLLEPDGKGGFTTNETAAAQFIAALTDWADCPMQPITTPSRLAEIMAEKAKLLKDATAQVLASDSAGEIGDYLASFREMLIADLSPDAFADLFAQTIAYGMFAARLNDDTPEDFSRQEAAALIPPSNPFLRKLFQRIAANDLDSRIAWIIDDLADAFAATDMTRVIRAGNDNLRGDPLIHFYENFLGAYDPALKKSCGVFYTPEPVVRFIVRMVDMILKCDFGLADGLADSSKVGEAASSLGEAASSRLNKKDTYSSSEAAGSRFSHRVQILDPATGTGTFLAETVRVIKERFAGNEGLWPGFVQNDLKPRLHGFELLMAPYTIAHLKLAMAMESEGTSRLSVYLTNSLEDGHHVPTLPFAQWLSDEANGAGKIKRDTPVMVMMGNPPYSVSSSNKSDWILNLIEDYKKGLNEKKLNLDDDYIKFIRLGQHTIDRNGSGILAFITNNSYLDGLTHRRMRQSLLESFDEIYIVNLHGNSKRKETAPDGGKDENVFDIMVGTAIAIFVKRGKGSGFTISDLRFTNEGVGDTSASIINHKSQIVNELARVHYVDLWGKRKTKFAALEALTLGDAMNRVSTVRPNVETRFIASPSVCDITPTWQVLAPRAPHYFFVPKDFSLEEEYNRGIKITDLFSVFNSGVKTDRDTLFLDDNPKALSARIQTLLSDKFSEDFTQQYNVTDSSSYKLTSVIKGKTFDAACIKSFCYRPFDFRNIYYDPEIISRPAFKVMRHMLDGDNVGLLVPRQCVSDWHYAFVTDRICDVNFTGTAGQYGAGHVFPLYRYEETMGRVEKVCNLNLDVVRRVLGDAMNRVRPNVETRFIASPAEEFFAYCYAVLHSPTYRERYKEFLKIDFPRIPLPWDWAKQQHWEKRLPAALKEDVEIPFDKRQDAASPRDAASLGVYRRLVALGQRLIDLHLMRIDFPNDVLPNFPIIGSNIVEEVRWENPPAGVMSPADRADDADRILGDAMNRVSTRERPNVETRFIASQSTQHESASSAESAGDNTPTGRIYINATQYFDHVPESSYNFFIGGYQPAQKWLKDRKNRTLTNDDLNHYRRLIATLSATAALMDEIG